LASVAEIGTAKRIETGAGLPVPLEVRAPRPSLTRSTPQAAFVSQLLAARQRTDLQRIRRRAPVNTAVDAYRAGSVITVRRLPQGYRRTVIV
jgi:hypothetical protein